MNVNVMNEASNLVPTPSVALRMVTTSSAIGVGTLNGNTERVLITVNSNAVRVTFDGSTPVAGSHGHLLAAGTVLTIHRDLAAVMKAVDDSGAGALAVSELQIRG